MKIFFSYSRQDGQAYAVKLASDLRTSGANIWIDQFNIEPGDKWDKEIEKALESSDCVLFIATEKSTISDNVLNEVFYAIDENKKVIPAIFQKCRMPLHLRRLQYVDFTGDYDDAFQRLLHALELKVPARDETTIVPVSPPQKVEEVKEQNAAPLGQSTSGKEDIDFGQQKLHTRDLKSSRRPMYIALFVGLIILVSGLIFLKIPDKTPDTELNRIAGLKIKAGKVNDAVVFNRYSDLFPLMSDGLKPMLTKELFNATNDSTQVLLGDFVKAIDTSYNRANGNENIFIRNQFSRGISLTMVIFDEAGNVFGLFTKPLQQ